MKRILTRHRRLVLCFGVIVLLAAIAGSAVASGAFLRRDFTEGSSQAAVNTEYVMIKFKSPPAASYEGGIPGLARTKPLRGRLDTTSPAYQAYLRHLKNEHANYRSWLSQNVKGAEIVREYSVVFNGMAIKLNGARAETLGGGPGVQARAFSSLYRPAMNVSTGLIGADALWSELGGQTNAGAGISVGVIDTGIDDTHDFFACKEIEHDVFASGVAPGAGFPTTLLAFDHGTHVAGTIGGCAITLSGGPVTGPISGVAPGATLHDYNVFPGFGAGFIAFGGSAFSHDIAAAIEQAFLDGMDIVNMSLGGSVQGSHDFLAEASDAAVDAGMIVAVAAGNSGPGDATVESPGSAHNVITAGASTNPHFVGISVTVSNVGTFGAALGDFNNFDPAILGASFSTTTPANGCTAIAEDLTGQIGVIDRGTCSFGTKIRNAEAAGAVGVIVVNNVAGDPVAMGGDGLATPNIPAAMVSHDDGDLIKPAAGSETMDVDGTSPTEFLTTNADIIAGFSSRGPTPFTYLIKPDVTAPGVNVYSSVFDNEFAMFQGTSMATPHVAGSAALLLDLHPGWSPSDVKSALVNNAARVVTDHILGSTDPGVLARGGGRVDLEAANNTPLTIDPPSASFGFWSGNKDVNGSLDLTVLNVSSSAQSCTVSVTGPSIVTASSANINLASGASTQLSLSLEAGRASQTGSGDYEGDVEIECGGTTLLAPWWVRISRNGKP